MIKNDIWIYFFTQINNKKNIPEVLSKHDLLSIEMNKWNWNKKGIDF